MATIRAANPGDVADLARLRCAFLREIGQVLPETFEANLRARFGASFSDATTLSWIAEDAGAIVGTISANPWRQLPTARNPDGTVWYVLNVYVVPSHRRRGLSRRLLETLIAAARDAGVRELNLHATSAGRPVYASLGFVSAEDIMELRLG